MCLTQVFAAECIHLMLHVLDVISSKKKYEREREREREREVVECPNTPAQTDICKCAHFQPITSTCFNRGIGVSLDRHFVDIKHLDIYILTDVTWSHTPR